MREFFASSESRQILIQECMTEVYDDVKDLKQALSIVQHVSLLIQLHQSPDLAFAFMSSFSCFWSPIGVLNSVKP